jgi:hypothetical protein
MIASWIFAGELLEAAMLTCFGLSWPISILKSLRTKRVKGKSLGFMYLVLSGYIAGAAGKIVLTHANGSPLSWVIALYIINTLLVATDILLYLRYRHNLEPATEEASHEIAKALREERSRRRALEHDTQR